MSHISQSAIARRRRWVSDIQKSTGDFAADCARIETALASEIHSEGSDVLIEHLRFAGDIPENFAHDSSEEKLYAKYTDILLSKTFTTLGLRSITLDERGAAADVEAFAPDYSFIADAKSFRLSRTAKNQKDFKVQSMARWKRGNPYALIVSPLHQLPARASQIYQQASANSVCVFTYSHLTILLAVAKQLGEKQAVALLREIFLAVSALNPSKDASAYWTAINRTMINFAPTIRTLWETEKQAALEALAFAKEASLNFLAQERRRIMAMTHEQALNELVKIHKLENKIAAINAVADNGIMAIN